MKRFKAPEVRRAELHGRSLSILNHRKGGLEDQQYIYLLEFELWIKLGRTGDPSRRFREHVKIAGEIVEVLHLEWLSEPKLMEDYLREQAKKAGIHCRGREWYPRSSKHFFVQLLRPTPTG